MKTTYLANIKNKYVQAKDGVVYKAVDDHFLQLSPWEDGQDRRLHEIEDENVKILSLENACMIVNKQFADKVEKWEYKNKHYIANATGNKDTNEHTYLLSTLPNHKFINTAKKFLKESKSQSISIESENGLSELKLVKHKGKIYYILIVNEFLPRVQMYNTFGKFCQWCNIKYCKPIYCEEDNKYI